MNRLGNALKQTTFGSELKLIELAGNETHFQDSFGQL